MSNCVTTPTHNGGQARTPAERRRRSETKQGKVERPAKSLRDEEVVGSNPATPTVKYQVKALPDFRRCLHLFRLRDYRLLRVYGRCGSAPDIPSMTTAPTWSTGRICFRRLLDR
ncbi:hypothetical protein SHKM778_03040 [Streptomyces sp. KM77-8]|uniref:Uncharacterized protein n=1 Tax=Streptomyces haneummycinicus TaxID=3074435 RepID=A0AAT9H915_9ACTN